MVTVIGSIDGDHRSTLGIVTNAVVTYTVFGLIGRLIAHSRSQALSSSQALTRAERELTRAEQEYEQRLQRSIESERQVMARELHDVAAFHLTGMIVQAKAADTVFHSDPAQAQSLLAEAITQGQRSLSSLRQIVGILRYSDGEERRPLPDVHDIAELIEQSQTSFASIEYDLRATDSEIDAIDTGAQLTCYRIVQESLANALRHAPRCDVRVALSIDRNALRIMVHNSLADEPRTTGCGFGIAGMKERATLLGGFATAGPEDNGWTVRAELPLTEGCEILSPDEHAEETL
ncbi:sensor histidine kinase [Rhodococcus sp. (in: high G+C Gram-positive bacteria)]|uniref:sensor histidine kinase n=1 Tax=Rhodococcus sp. TaxID=1831 RepID=UPI003B8A750F